MSLIAVVLAFFYRRWGWLYFFVAFAIAWSRSLSRGALAERCGGDIFLAAGMTALLLALCEALYRWSMAKWAPQFFARHPRLVGDAIS